MKKFITMNRFCFKRNKEWNKRAVKREKYIKARGKGGEEVEKEEEKAEKSWEKL